MVCSPPLKWSKKIVQKNGPKNGQKNGPKSGPVHIFPVPEKSVNLQSKHGGSRRSYDCYLKRCVKNSLTQYSFYVMEFRVSSNCTRNIQRPSTYAWKRGQPKRKHCREKCGRAHKKVSCFGIFSSWLSKLLFLVANIDLWNVKGSINRHRVIESSQIKQWCI